MSGGGSALLVALARTLPIAWLVPGLGAVGGRLARLVVAVALAALALPAATTAATTALDASALLALVLRELSVGVALGLVAAAPFRAAAAAGALLDVARAPRLPSHAAAPVSLEREGALRRLFAVAALAVFAAVDGPARWAAALAGSYHALPVGAALDARGGIASAVSAGGAIIGWAVTLAAPLLAALLVAELVVGLVERALPSVTAEAMAVPRQLALLAALGLGAAALVGTLARATETATGRALLEAATSLVAP